MRYRPLQLIAQIWNPPSPQKNSQHSSPTLRRRIPFKSAHVARRQRRSGLFLCKFFTWGTRFSCRWFNSARPPPLIPICVRARACCTVNTTIGAFFFAFLFLTWGLHWVVQDCLVGGSIPPDPTTLSASSCPCGQTTLYKKIGKRLIPICVRARACCTVNTTIGAFFFAIVIT